MTRQLLGVLAILALLLWQPASAAVDQKVLQAGATTGSGAIVQITNAAQMVTVYVTGNGTITGGTVVIEESDDDAFTGTWSSLQSISASSLSGSVKVAVHVQAPVGYIRARISAAITGGGTIDATVMGV